MTGFLAFLLGSSLGALIGAAYGFAASRKQVRKAEADALDFAFARQIECRVSFASPEDAARRGGA